METFKLGDVVARKSYNCDILFKIIGIRQNGMIDLAGLTVRIVADAPDYDLKHMSPEEIDKMIKNVENSRRARLSRSYANMNKKFNYNYMREQINSIENPTIFQKDTILKKPGIILHLDRRCRIYR